MRKILFILILLLVQSASALTLYGNESQKIIFLPNYANENTITISNNDGNTFSYDIILENYKGIDLRKYFTISQDRFNMVPDKDKRTFTVKLALPKNLRLINPSITRIIIKTISQNLDEFPATAVIDYEILPSYYSYSALPEKKTLGCKYIKVNNFKKSDRIAPLTTFEVFVKSEWQYKIRDAYAEISFYDLETHEKILDFRTDFTDIEANHNAALIGNFDAAQLESRNYTTVIRLYYEGLVSYYEYDGNKTITSEYDCGQKEELVIEPDCYGCLLDDECMKYGNITKQNNISIYCASIDEWLPQKQEGEPCYNNFECLSNLCKDSLCYEIKEEVIENRNLLQKILDWLSSIFKKR